LQYQDFSPTELKKVVKKLLITLAKYGVSIGIIYWLICDVQSSDPETFTRLRNEPKNWALLTAATVLCLVAVMTTIVRWYLLVRALDLPFRLRDAFRLGFLGYMLNFVSVGSVGGDLFKAVFIAREQPDRRAQAVATVVVDRLFGLYALLVVASAGILVSGVMFIPNMNPKIVTTSWIALALTTAGLVGISLLALPGFRQGRVATWLSNLPKVGPTMHSLLDAVAIYRGRPDVLVIAFVMSLVTHAVFTASVYLMACGLPGAHPTLTDHFFIVPMSMVTGTLPLPGGGLGAFEFVMDFYYRNVAAFSTVKIAKGQGLLVALAYRASTIAVAVVGLVYYLMSRNDVSRVIHEAEEEMDAEA
jgi:uncharacterized protein (TIRG00374 family)